MLSRKSRLGFSLIEAAIVLGIVGLVIGGIWTAAASVSLRNQVNGAMEAIAMGHEKAQALHKSMLNGDQVEINQSVMG